MKLTRLSATRSSTIARIRAPVAVLLGLMLSLPASQTAIAWEFPNPLDLFGSDKGQIVWSEGNQSVNLVEQDRFDKYRRPPKNDHPVNLSAGDLAAVLGTLRHAPQAGRTTPDRFSPLFAPDQARVLAAKLAEGLSRARHDEDVIFKMNGASGMIAGRVFMSAGKLNIIFGDLAGAGGDARPGMRRIALDEFSGAIGGPGTVAYMNDGKARNDWAVIDIPTAVAAYGYLRRPSPRADATGGAPAEALERENRRLRAELARMRSDEGTETRLHPAPPRPASESGDAPGRGSINRAIENRMLTLKSLHDQKLITDEEYETKRKEILKDL